jgi:transposase
MHNLNTFFINPTNPAQKQYEAIRAIIVDGLPIDVVAKKFSYSVSTLYSLIRDVKCGAIELFPSRENRGPKQRQTPDYIQSLIFSYRKLDLSCNDIAARLQQEGYKISKSTVGNVIADSQLPKLPRRTNLERGLTQKNQAIPERSKPIDFSNLEQFNIDVPVCGIFFFIPYIIESGIIDIIKNCALPQSSSIDSTQACLSMLALKLIGNERLSHMDSYDHEPGFGLFSGLNFLPKSTYMATYSCRTSEEMVMQLQAKIIAQFRTVFPSFYQGEFINLDFHSIPHFGTESQMEHVWCGARGKAMKGANTLLAQDSQSNAVLYTHADILRKDEPAAIQEFVSYWKKITKTMSETLVFDCKLTSYSVLDELATDNVKFITLRKCNKALLAKTLAIKDEEWSKLYLPIPKRQNKHCRVYETVINLPKCKQSFRQIIIKDHGRANPTFVITNNNDLPLKEVLIVYAKRWHIENKIAELVSFFNLNALSSPLMIRIHFDMLWTVIADTLYHRFAQDLPRFEKVRANTIFRKFIDMPGKISFDGENFKIKIRKHASTPILLGVQKLKNNITVPWLDNRKISIEWTA